MENHNEMHKIIILGSGNAGYTAAIYAARANLHPLVLVGEQQGGQLMITSDVENYPGFPEGILGPELMNKFQKQAERFGAQIINKNATKVDFSSRPFTILSDKEVYQCKSVIICTGSSPKWLGLESETRLLGSGVSSCATCDGAFFQGKDVCVVGGGDTAMEESLFLTKFASRVTVVHRRDTLRASRIMQDRALKNDKITFRWNSVVEEVLGNKIVEGVLLKNVKTNEGSKYPCQGLFIAIGHTPNTEIFKSQIKLDARGYIETWDNTKTNIEGIFAAGDVQDPTYKQAITAAGSGCMAAIDAGKYIESK